MCGIKSPTPSSPSLFSPQHCAVPSISTAHDVSLPVLMLRAGLAVATNVGVLREVVVPSPIPPSSLLPQHDTPPSPSSTQTWS